MAEDPAKRHQQYERYIATDKGKAAYAAAKQRAAVKRHENTVARRGAKASLAGRTQNEADGVTRISPFLPKSDF